MLIRLFMGALILIGLLKTKEEKSLSFDVHEINTRRGKKLIFPSLHFFERYERPSSCKLFVRYSCGYFAAFSHGSHEVQKGGSKSMGYKTSSSHYLYLKRHREKTRVFKHEIGHVTRQAPYL